VQKRSQGCTKLNILNTIGSKHSTQKSKA